MVERGIMNRIEIKVEYIYIPNQRIFVVADERGESESYEAFSLHCLDANDRLVWTEGIRKDRSNMWPYWREAIEQALKTLKGEQS